MRSQTLPSLSENSTLRYCTFILLYFSQGIPEGITIFGIPAWMAMNGKTAVEIAGYSAITMIPFSLKILLAPIMERYTWLPMGRRKPWLLFGQFGIFLGLLGLSFVPEPLHHIPILCAAVLFIHMFILFQDIATDSLVIDIVPLEEQGKANSYMWGSKTIGTSISLAVGSWLMQRYGLAEAGVCMSVLVCIIMVVPVVLRERKGEKLQPWSSGTVSPEADRLAVTSWKKLLISFKKVVLLPNTLLLLLTLFITMAAIHFMRTLLPIFTIQELGWTNVHYSRIFSISSLCGGILGMLIGGVAIQRYGVIRMMQGAYVLIGVLTLGMAMSAALWQIHSFVYAFMGLFCALLTLINIGGLALAMQLCWKRISAMQFTFCMTIFNLGLAAGAALLGYFRTFCDWQALLLIFTLFIVVSMFVIRFIKTERQSEQIEQLELDYLQQLKIEHAILVKADLA